jgi:hypothetical protein
LRALLTDENGQRKGVTDGMRFCVLLNKADDASQKQAALETARVLRQRAVWNAR